MTDMEEFVDRQRKDRLFNWARDDGKLREGIDPEQFSRMMVDQSRDVVTALDALRAMRSVSGMRFVLWRCLSAHHAGIEQKTVLERFTEEQLGDVFDRLLKASGFTDEDEEKAAAGDPTVPTT